MHDYAKSKCMEPRICKDCGHIGQPIEHDWVIHQTDIIECRNCGERITHTDIRAKSGSGLLDVEKALIYKKLDEYLTATNKNGKYIFTEKEAFEEVQKMFGVSRNYLDNNIWNNHAWDAYRKYCS